MIVALAGRRIDAENAKERRFPLENVELVRQASQGDAEDGRRDRGW